MATAHSLAENAAEIIDSRLITYAFEVIMADNNLHAAYKELLKRSRAKNPAQAVNSAIGRAVGRMYGLKGSGRSSASLIKSYSKLVRR